MSLLVVLLAALAAFEGGHARAKLPDGWAASPDAAAAVKQRVGARADFEVDAVAAGDARAGVFAVLVWVASKKPVSGGVRAELAACLASLGRVAGGTWTTQATATR